MAKKKEAIGIKYIAIGELSPRSNNPRKHPKGQIDLIAKSIVEFGFVNPILTRKGEIVAGHGRLMAAEKLGLKTVPVIALDYLSTAQASAYLIADNKLTDIGGWDDDLLADVLAEISAEDDALLALTGMSEQDILSILDGPNIEALTELPDDLPTGERETGFSHSFTLPPRLNNQHTEAFAYVRDVAKSSKPDDVTATGYVYYLAIMAYKASLDER